MATPFKNHIDAAAVQAIAQHDRRGWPGREPASVTRQPVGRLDRLELSVRVMQEAQALAVHINGRVLAGTTSSEATIEAAGNGCLRSAPSHAARRSLAPAR